jgi:hypothetical protein
VYLWMPCGMGSGMGLTPDNDHVMYSAAIFIGDNPAQSVQWIVKSDEDNPMTFEHTTLIDNGSGIKVDILRLPLSPTSSEVKNDAG